MTKTLTIEKEIESFLNEWGCDEMVSFLRDVSPLYELYDVDEDDDWVAKLVGKDQETTIRLIRTVYLLSRISEFHAGKFLNINMKYKKLWKRMEKEHGKMI